MKGAQEGSGAFRRLARNREQGPKGRMREGETDRPFPQSPRNRRPGPSVLVLPVSNTGEQRASILGACSRCTCGGEDLTVTGIDFEYLARIPNEFSA